MSVAEIAIDLPVTGPVDGRPIRTSNSHGACSSSLPDGARFVHGAGGIAGQEETG